MRHKSPIEKALGLEAGEAYGADEDVSTEVGTARILGYKVEFSQNENTSYITGWVKGIGFVGGGYSLEEAQESARENLAVLRNPRMRHNPPLSEHMASDDLDEVLHHLAPRLAADPSEGTRFVHDLLLAVYDGLERRTPVEYAEKDTLLDRLSVALRELRHADGEMHPRHVERARVMRYR